MADAIPFNSAVREALHLVKSRLPDPAAGSPQGDLVEELRNQFGVGGNPQLRINLYHRLKRIVDQHGIRAQQVIDEVRSMARAPGIRNQGNYFARAIVLRLREAGIV